MQITKRKKITSLVLAFVMSFGLTSCFGSPANSGSSQGGASSSDSQDSASSSEWQDSASSSEWQDSASSSEWQDSASSSEWQDSSSDSQDSTSSDTGNSDSDVSSGGDSSSDDGANDSTEDSSMSSGEVLFFENGMPNYDAHEAEQMIFNAWFAPAGDKSAYQTYKDCGFTHIFLMGNNVGYIGLDTSYKPKFLEKLDTALGYCDELGIKAYLDISDCALNGMTAAQGKSGVLAAIEQYNAHPSFVGTCYDEPVVNTNTLNKRWGVVEMGPVIQAMATQYPAKEFMINSNPSTNTTFPWGTSAFTYEEYWEAQLQSINAHYKGSSTLNWLSADDYPLYIDNAGNKFLKEEWLECMGYLAVFKRDKTDLNLKTNFFLQSAPFESGRQFMRDRTPTYNDLRMQMYTLMAFGYDSLSFFTYATPPAGGDFSETQLGLVDRSGNTTATYTNSKKVIGEIKTFANTYMQFNGGWKGVWPIIGSSNTAGTRTDFTNLRRIGDGTKTKRMQSAITPRTWFGDAGIISATATQDTVMGCMNDKWGNPGLMLVNYNDTSKNLSSTVNVQFAAAKYDKAWVYIDGVQTEAQLVNGKLTVQLDVGEGVFVIPVKKA